MTLPEIVLPKVVLPFDVPVLLHPVVDHFLIALPVVVLLLELMNLAMRKRAVGGVSFFLLVLTATAAVAAYFTGLADAKEAYPALAEAAKAELSEHKLLGIYILLGSGVVLFFKLLAMTGNKALKALYLIVLIVFVAALFKQGEEGGELVYEHGLNVEQVNTLKDDIADLKDELEDEAEETPAKETKEAVSGEVKKETTKEIPSPAPVVPDSKPQSGTDAAQTPHSAERDTEDESTNTLQKAHEIVQQALEVPATTIE